MGPRVPRVIKRGAIRAEGKRRHYSGDDLDDFVEILAAIDNVFVAEGVKAAAKAKPPDGKKEIRPTLR